MLSSLPLNVTLTHRLMTETVIQDASLFNCGVSNQSHSHTDGTAFKTYLDYQYIQTGRAGVRTTNLLIS